MQCSAVQCSAMVPRRGQCSTWNTARAGWRASPPASCSPSSGSPATAPPSAWTPVEEPAAWQVAAGLAVRGMSGAWPAVPVLEQAECWLAGLPMVTVPEMCFQSRDLRSEVFKEVQEELEGDEDDVTSNDEDYESDFVCEECEDCVKENVTLLECLNHVLEK